MPIFDIPFTIVEAKCNLLHLHKNKKQQCWWTTIKKYLLRWSTHRVACTGCAPPPSSPPERPTIDDDSRPQVETAPNRETWIQINDTKPVIRKQSFESGELTKSILGLVLNAWKSLSFIDTRMLASKPREVLMPYKTYTPSGEHVFNTVQTAICMFTSPIVAWVTFLSG